MMNPSQVGVSLLLWLALACQGPKDELLGTNGIPIRYQVSGRGTSVVLLHGFGETLESWQRAGVVQLLSPHFRVIAMDVRGHGSSGKPHAAGSYGRELARDVIRLLDQHGAAKAHVVGYSMGALIALDVAAFHQERVLSLAVGGTGWPEPDVLGDFRQQAAALEQDTLPMREGEDRKALAALLRDLRVLSDAEVRRIASPVLALIGANDRFMSDVQRLSHAVPGTKVVVIPDANHATAMNHPKFGEALVAWLLEQR
jgi:pimeloyl-ACP methyl ester carboxylesterase